MTLTMEGRCQTCHMGWVVEWDMAGERVLDAVLDLARGTEVAWAGRVQANGFLEGMKVALLILMN